MKGPALVCASGESEQICLKKRLDCCLNLHVHKEMTDKLNMADVGNQFVSASNDRRNCFGKFVAN